MMSGMRFSRRMGLFLVGALLMTTLMGLLPPASVSAYQNQFGFAPQRYQSGYTYGNGVFFAPYRFKVYMEPRLDAAVIAEFRWNRETATNGIDAFLPNGDHHVVHADHLFFCFYPQLDVAMMSVTGDSDNNDWVEVMYDQANHKAGWVQTKGTEAVATKSTQSAKSTALVANEPAHFGIYQTWLEFMRLNAKPSGIYWLSGVKEYNRSLRVADKDEAKLIPVTIVRDLKVKHVRSNWLLVEVLDFERNSPIGWVRWRDDEGNLMVFPNISGQHMPVVTTAY